MNGPKEIYEILEQLNIGFEYNEHPPTPTIEIARQYWKYLDSIHCKNLFVKLIFQKQPVPLQAGK